MNQVRIALTGLILILNGAVMADSDFVRHLGYHSLGNAIGQGLHGPSPYVHPYAPYYPGFFPWGRGYYGLYGGPSEGDFGGPNVTPAGRIVLEVRPDSAEVYINGQQVSQRDDHSFQEGVLVGSHTIEVGAPGYQTYYNEVNVSPGRVVRLTINLVQK